MPPLWSNCAREMNTQFDLAPVARLDFVARGASEPGWYVRYVVDGRPMSARLTIELGADAFGAIEQAAHFLGCSVDQIEFGGPVWPMPLDGMVDSDETLEYVADPLPGITDHEGEWRLLARDKEERRGDTRRYARKRVDGVLLYGPVYGRVLNWSEAGMGIEVARPLRLETRDVFIAKGKRSKTELYGEVRWCRQVETSGLDTFSTFHVGVALIA